MEKTSVTTIKDIELTAAKDDKTDDTQKLNVKVSFHTHVGWDGTLVLLSMLLISGLFGYLTYIYTSWFVKFNRDFVWAFIIMGCLFLFLILYYLIRWRNMVKKFMEEENAASKEEEEEHKDTSTTSWFDKAKSRYNDFQIIGKYYLLQLYMLEIIESMNQIINVFTVYTCSLPVEITSILCILLGMDCFHTTKFMIQDNNPGKRDRQIIIDTCMDFLCVIVPIFVMYFGYRVPISVQDMLQITCIQTFTMLMKLDTILEEIIRSRTAKATLQAQEKTAAKVDRHRKSLFRGLSHYEIGEQQQIAIPKVVHMGAGCCKFIFGILFMCIGIAHLAVQNDVQCEPELLWKSCEVKVPFCGDMFKPTCNCVVLDVKKHNWTVLPKEMNEMMALKVMKVNHGPLEKLSEIFDVDFSKVVFLDLSYNALSNIPKSIGDIKIKTLKLANNKLVEIPDSIWGNVYTVHLEFDNNNISSIPLSVQKATALNRLFMTNNSLVDLRDNIFDNLKLYSLFLDGNKLKSIPQSVLSMKTLRNLKISDNYISHIPKDIMNLMELDDIDLRNNTIASLPNEFEKLSNTLTYIYLHNNPICTNKWLDTNVNIKEMIESSPGAGCEEQCSIYCQDRYLGNGICGGECNFEDCKFDGGDCT